MDQPISLRNSSDDMWLQKKCCNVSQIIYRGFGMRFARIVRYCGCEESNTFAFTLVYEYKRNTKEQLTQEDVQ